jgi:hypothetical protein
MKLYKYDPHNDVSVNDGPHIRRWSHKIIIFLKNTIVLQLPAGFITVTCGAEYLGLHNKPKAAVHPGHKRTGPKEDEDESAVQVRSRGTIGYTI